MNIDNPFSLKGKRILISGATSGLGHATALACARMGAVVIGLGRNPERLESTKAALLEISEHHELHSVELTDSTARDRFTNGLKGQLDGIVHSAGTSRVSPVRMLTEQHLRFVQSANVESPMLLTQGLLKRNLIAPNASLVFVASIAAHIGVPGVAAYSGTKAAIIAMVRCLAMEVVKHKIRANCLSPGLVDTPLLEAAATVVGSMEKELKNYPLGFGTPNDVAHAAIFLLSDASRWITGTTIVMDGGLTIS